MVFELYLLEKVDTTFQFLKFTPILKNKIEYEKYFKYTKS